MKRIPGQLTLLPNLGVKRGASVPFRHGMRHLTDYSGFEFDGSDPRLTPQPNAVIPEEIKLPTDNPDWQPSRG